MAKPTTTRSRLCRVLDVAFAQRTWLTNAIEHDSWRGLFHFTKTVVRIDNCRHLWERENLSSIEYVLDETASRQDFWLEQFGEPSFMNLSEMLSSSMYYMHESSRLRWEASGQSVASSIQRTGRKYKFQHDRDELDFLVANTRHVR